MLIWGLASRELNEAIDLYPTRAEAEQAIVDVLADEPSWEELLFVTPMSLQGPETPPSLN